MRNTNRDNAAICVAIMTTSALSTFFFVAWTYEQYQTKGTWQFMGSILMSLIFFGVGLRGFVKNHR